MLKKNDTRKGRIDTFYFVILFPLIIVIFCFLNFLEGVGFRRQFEMGEVIKIQLKSSKQKPCCSPATLDILNTFEFGSRQYNIIAYLTSTARLLTFNSNYERIASAFKTRSYRYIFAADTKISGASCDRSRIGGLYPVYIVI